MVLRPWFVAQHDLCRSWSKLISWRLEEMSIRRLQFLPRSLTPLRQFLPS
jgi:hypothetical protein